jgi:hypothetical protein
MMSATTPAAMSPPPDEQRDAVHDLVAAHAVCYAKTRA